MDAYENDDYLPDEGHLVSGKPRKSKHIDAGGPGGRPGQRGKNKREHGEKPVVTVKWGPQLTEQLWALIKTKPELKKVLVNEPTRFLGPHGAAGQLFSKKDLQRTIAEHLFGEGQYDLSDQVIVDNLTRAVKNKLHKTQMLYEASLRELPANFAQYQSESEIPPTLRAKWAKVKDRFPTYFEYHELAQEIPTITAQMEIDAQKLGAWKAKALSGSEDGSPGSFISNRQRSRSVDTSASWDAPELEGSPPLPHQLLPDDQDFEVLPPPADQRANLSDLESVGIPNATSGIGIGSGLGSISPGLSPISPNAGHLNLQGSGRWSPSLPSGPIMPMGLSQPMVVNPIMRPASSDNLPHQWSPLAEHRNPSQQASLDGGAYDGSIIQGAAWTTEPSSLVSNINGIGSRYPAIPMTSVPQTAGHLTAQNSLQAQESRHSSGGLVGVRRRRPAHERVHSGGALSSDFPPESVDANSPYSAGYSSTSGSPDMPMDPDSPRDDRTMEQLLQILREKETRKQRRMEEWLKLKQKRLEDREQQRQENQRQREENERQRQHEIAIMEQKLRLAQLDAQQRRYQSQTDSMRSGSVATNESEMQSPDQSIAALAGFGQDGTQTQGHQMQYQENMMLFSTPMPSGQSMMDHPLALMGSHTPVQQGMLQRKPHGGMGASLGMGQFQQSPIIGPGSMNQGFGDQAFSDAQLDELLGGGMHHGHSGGA